MISGFNGEYAFLSNMYPCEIEYKGYKFPSSEHLYQGLKIPNTQEGQWWRDKIREAVHGKVAKKLAANPKCPKIDNFYEDEKIRVMFMLKAIVLKFNIPEMSEKLMATGEEELIEENYGHDTFGGMCNGEGKNMLGKILMGKRNILLFYKTQPTTLL